ncbi:MAG: hypothetical protein Q8R51_00940, partial [Azonexus sp.]|nr:hypothetical protein [Azonexus sp.]
KPQSEASTQALRWQKEICDQRTIKGADSSAPLVIAKPIARPVGTKIHRFDSQPGNRGLCYGQLEISTCFQVRFSQTLGRLANPSTPTLKANTLTAVSVVAGY